MDVGELVLQLADEHPDWTNQQLADEVRRQIPGARTSPASVSSTKSNAKRVGRAAIKRHVRPGGRRSRRSGAAWATWPQPNEEALLALARVMVPFVRFLDPGIVQAVVEDNRRMAPVWSGQLEAVGIEPAIYLWEGSPCAFPGVRRYSGSAEIAAFRKRARREDPPPHCLTVDDNDYPKHMWAFVFTGKPFRKRGPRGYQLAHLFDHQEYGNRWCVELDGARRGNELPILPYGLFTSAANAVFVPSAFLRPTDFSPKLRSLIQRRAFHLYENCCCLVPPPLKGKPCDDRAWALDNFQWSAPVGGMGNVPHFLKFRGERMRTLIERRRGKSLS